MISRRWPKITLRCSFITSSNFNNCLRMSKLRPSTLACARSSDLFTQGCIIASPSFMPSVTELCPNARTRKSASDHLQVTRRTTTDPDHPDGRNGRATGYRCGGFRGARWPEQTRPPASITLFLRQPRALLRSRRAALRVGIGLAAIACMTASRHCRPAEYRCRDPPCWWQSSPRPTCRHRQ